MDDGEKTYSEVDAILQVQDALSRLQDSGERARVLRWAFDKFNVIQPKTNRADEIEKSDDEEDSQRTEAAGSLAELYAQASPRGDAEKALVVAYWLQGDGESFTAHAVNKELNHLGDRCSNITVALNSLKDRRPAFVIQTRKAGTSQQARKIYKVTPPGKAKVKEMLQSKAVE